jgi:ADP-heptose:LPS heptosyltransferase
MPAHPNKILVIRNDKLGDFMLAWPVFSLLKQQYPDCKLTALVPEYTAPMAEQCEWIDEILIDNRKPSFIKDVVNLSSNIRKHRFDASISLFSEARTSAALWLAGVKTRVGPATKVAQIFLNKALKQRRSRSSMPEYQYNLDLARHYIKLNGDDASIQPSPPYLRFDDEQIERLKNDFYKLNDITDNTKMVIIHPGTGGSAINLSLEQYAALAKYIAAKSRVFFVITAGPGELDKAESLSELMQDINHTVHQSTGSIIEFCRFINTCDLFISGSTGPLHIAGALNINTAAFYPARKSATSLRWETLNEADKRISFSPKIYTGKKDMQKINTEQAAEAISNKFFL